MKQGHSIAVVIPALNEERAIGRVLADIPGWVDLVVVADNGSTDRTAAIAASGGAVVVRQPEPGYGAACLAGIARAGTVDIVVFLDGDYSDYPQDMDDIVAPILAGEAEMVIGSRVLGEREAGSLMPQQRFGNWLATRLIRLIWRVGYTDLGPFRAIRADSLARLGMADRTYGWTVEMQIKGAIAGLAVREVPVRYRRRIGTSKVSGTVKGTILAGWKILSLIGRYALRAPPGLQRAR
ncbi:MAG: glycosyltransferase family 2 protein [Hyphomicrobiaceae bacterium]